METTLNALIVLMLVGFGGYCLYTGVLLRIRGCLFDNRILYPGGCKMEDCLDEYGFVDFMIPRLFLAGGICLALGAFTAVIYFTEWLAVPGWFEVYVLPFLGLFVIVWYIILQKKAAKRFW